MSSLECAADTKPASKAEGAKYTHSSTMRWKKRLKRSALHAITLAKRSTVRSSVKNSPNMPHTWLVDSGMPQLSAASASRCTSTPVVAFRCSWKPGSEMSPSVAMPAAMASGLPLRVPAW